MKDLCIDARIGLYSGIGTYIREIVPFFLHSSFRLSVLVDRIDSAWDSRVSQIVFRAPIYSIREQLEYPLKIPACDLFWSPHYNVPLLPIRAKKRIATIHDAYHLVYGSWGEALYAKRVMGCAVRRSDLSITVSAFSKQAIERFFPKSRLHAIPIGVNRNRFQPAGGSDRIRQKYQLPDRFVLFVGSTKPHKNLKGLISAFANIERSDLKLVAVGKGTPRGVVEDEELSVLYGMAEALVFPSFYEGFGLPPLEAMSCGCPTVVSNAASIPEVCGDASLYFDPANPKEMAESILKAVDDREMRQVLIQRGFERVQQFSWAQCAERHIRLFEELSFA